MSLGAVGMLRVSRAVASSAKVLITGDGGDDVFLGYPEHRHLWIANKLSHTLPASLKTLWLTSRSVFPRIGPLRRAAALFDYTTGHLNAFFGNTNDWPTYKTNGLLGDRLMSLLRDPPDVPRPMNGKDEVIEDF